MTSSSRIGRPVQSRIALAERGEAAVVARVEDRARVDRPGPGRGRRTRPRTTSPRIRDAAGLPSAPTRPAIDELLAEPGGLLAGGLEAADAAGGRVDLDGDRLVARAPGRGPRRRPAGAAGASRFGLAGHPGVAEGGQVDDGPDPFVGELRGAERPLGAEVGGGVGQEHGRAAGDAQRVEDEVAGPARRRRRRRSPAPAPRPRPARGRRAPPRPRRAGRSRSPSSSSRRAPGPSGSVGAVAERLGQRRGAVDRASNRARSRACSARREIGRGSLPGDGLREVGRDVVVGLGPEASRTGGRSGGSSR